uniref:Uncharacterized protein n=1 Tax=Oncorhynchus mykiss TaxID=8022 RepID=A0A8C7NFA9_ONCMY
MALSLKRDATCKGPYDGKWSKTMVNWARGWSLCGSTDLQLCSGTSWV